MLEKAIISMKANFDGPKLKYLTRTCQKLKYLEICGSGVIGDSLISALPLAKRLESIVCGVNCEMSLASVQSILKINQKTLLEATFLRIIGNRIAVPQNQWPELHSLRILNLRSSADYILDIVSHIHPTRVDILEPTVTTGWTSWQNPKY